MIAQVPGSTQQQRISRRRSTNENDHPSTGSTQQQRISRRRSTNENDSSSTRTYTTAKNFSTSLDKTRMIAQVPGSTQQ